MVDLDTALKINLDLEAKLIKEIEDLKSIEHLTRDQTTSLEYSQLQLKETRESIAKIKRRINFK